ncbi:MAG: ABC transporter permease [Bacteroidales bacterium]|nr:ABC transporter permease [Bacteroidales bacterium]
MKKNKLRTFLTGFSIAWGIFMLIILLGSGNGLKNGMSENFKYMSSNSVTLWPGWTSEPWKGMQKGRTVTLKQKDVEFLTNKYKGKIYSISPSVRTSTLNISNAQEYVTLSINGIYPDYQEMRSLEMFEGRFINESDIKGKKKVLVIHKRTKEALFKNGENALGCFVNVNNIPYKIVGVYNDGFEQNPDIYAPSTTIVSIYKPNGEFNNISFEVKGISSPKEMEAFITDLRNNLSILHNFKPDDRNALWIRDRLSDYLQTQGIFNGIALFVWIIGIGTLIAGVVGISNIMLITVKERTKEFGIRKAIGATPSSILKLVFIESIFITALFGYVGMVFGVGLTELINYVLEMNSSGPSNPENMTMFRNPTVDLSVVFLATFILIVAGVIAGYVPAKKAVSIKPIDALRGE